MLEKHITSVWDYCQINGNLHYSESTDTWLARSIFSRKQVMKDPILMAYLVGEALALLQFKNLPVSIYESTRLIAQEVLRQRLKKDPHILLKERFIKNPIEFIKNRLFAF